MALAIQRLHVTGLKGATARTFELGAGTLLCGPVGAGKSVVADAIAFGLLGYVPRIGKSDAATMRLAAEREITVTLEFADGRVCSRTLRKEGRANTSEATASWMPAGKLTEISESIRALAGVDATEAAENLDVARLLDRSGADLARTVDALLAGAGMNPDARGKAAVDLLHQRLESQREKVDGLVQPIAPAVVAASALVGEQLRVHATAGLQGAIEWAGQEKRAAATEIRQQRAAQEELRARQAEVEGPAQSAEVVAAVIREHESRVSALGATITEGARVAERRVAAQAQLQSAFARLESAEQAHVAAQGRQGRAAELRAEAEALTDPEAPLAPTLDATMGAAVESARVALSEAEIRAAAVVVPEAISTIAAESTEAELRRVVDRLRSSPWHEVREIADTLPPDTCAEQRAALHALADAHGGDLQSALEEHAQAEAALTQRRALASEREAERTAAQALADEAAAAVQECRRIRDAAEATEREARTAADAAYREALHAHHERVEANAATRAILRDEAEEIDFHVDTSAKAVQEARADVARLQSVVEELTAAAPHDLDRLRAEQAEHREAAESNAAVLAAARQAEAIQHEVRRLLEAIAQAEAGERCYAAAEFAAKRLRDQDMQAKSAGLAGRLAAFLEAAGRPEVPYVRTVRGSAEIGWTRPDGRDVDLRTLSGGETVVLRAALAYALLGIRNPAVQVLALELAEASDTTTAEAILRGCAGVAEGMQVVAASCAPVVAPAGWRVVECGMTVEA